MGWVNEITDLGKFVYGGGGEWNRKYGIFVDGRRGDWNRGFLLWWWLWEGDDGGGWDSGGEWWVVAEILWESDEWLQGKRELVVAGKRGRWWWLGNWGRGVSGGYDGGGWEFGGLRYRD